jgi:hypothetical protein
VDAALMVSPFTDIAIARTDVPAEKLADNSFAEYAAKELGRFE